MTPVMRARNLRVILGERFTLEVPRLDLLAGEVVSVMGPSGSGKTTLLRLLATLQRPSTGEVRFGELSWSAEAGNGSAVRRSNPRELLAWRRRMGFVPQNPVLFSGTVGENVALGLELRSRQRRRSGPGRPKPGPVDGSSGLMHDRVAEVLETVGLAALIGEPAASLSAGEAQRVALARALIHRPEVLFLDEPTANLDPANVAIIEQALAAAVAAWRPAVLLVTHNLFQARRVADRTGLLIGGKMIEFGPTRQVFEAPADPRTAAFVRGEMVF